MPIGGANECPLSTSPNTIYMCFHILSKESLCNSPLCLDFEARPVLTPHHQSISTFSLNKYVFSISSVECLDQNAKLPTPGSIFATGYDLYSCEPCVSLAYSRKHVTTKIAIAIASSIYASISPHFGLAAEHSIDIEAVVVDENYHRPVQVLLINQTNIYFKVNINDRIPILIL